MKVKSRSGDFRCLPFEVCHPASFTHSSKLSLASPWYEHKTSQVWKLHPRLQTGSDNMLDLYSHYKFYHFFSICFGLGCGLCSYRPYYSLVMPVVLTVFCMFVFEAVGWCSGVPPHTRQCNGPPFHWRDALWGFIFALIVAVLHLHSYHVYTLSHGSGMAVFAIRGAIRRCRALWLAEGQDDDVMMDADSFGAGANGRQENSAVPKNLEISSMFREEFENGLVLRGENVR
ncbi:hypothetical protein AMELA_G00003110 [Ameiurus melas]|uniref:Uncharacterized protein n=1 Tax=Ameiurus melas TaxID=219545 RepID=A0A7J6BFY9_AMEME|nr:hypothetical protein AMELA_G00003110 [Ameiurus melas]